MPITYESNTSFGFNITIGLNDKEINITADNLNDVKTKGLKFELPPESEVELGSLSELIVWLNKQLKDSGIDVTLPSAAGSDWPDAIKNIFDGVLNTKVTVSQLSIDQAPQDADGNYPPLKLNLAVKGIAVDPADPSKNKPIPIIGGLFSIVGGGITLKRGYTESTNPEPDPE